jgi:hypothetical protein
MPFPNKKAPKVKLRTGKLNDKEKGTIRELMGDMTMDAIALRLRRTEKIVTAYANEIVGYVPEAKLTVMEELDRSIEWSAFIEKFLPSEVPQARNMYLQLSEQFGRDDMRPAERYQLFEIIEIHMLKARILVEQRISEQESQAAFERIEELNIQIRNMQHKSGKDILQQQLDLEKARYDIAKASKKAATDNYDKYQAMASKNWRQLKLTREQRIKDLTSDGANSFLGLLKNLLDAEWRQQAGDEVGYMEVAIQHERERLSAPHKYDDGMIDQPLLTSDTVEFEFRDEEAESDAEGDTED